MSDGYESVGSHFLKLWRLRSMMSEGGEEAHPVPTELVRFPHKLSVYTHSDDYCAVRAKYPAPVKRLLYFFEIKIEIPEIEVQNLGIEGQIAIGFTAAGFGTCKLPGFEANSIGYHMDGHIHLGKGKEKANGKRTEEVIKIGIPYSVGDTIGAGINNGTNEFFFTKNRLVVATVCNNLQHRLYPTVPIICSKNEMVKVNFGEDRFCFDLKRYEATLWELQNASFVMKISDLSTHSIVHSFLQHIDYKETQKSLFNESTRITASLRQLIMDGNIDDAIDTLRRWYPEVVKDDTSPFCFMLHYQKAIELFRDQRVIDSLTYAKTNFQKFAIFKKYKHFMQDFAALCAYEDPKKSEMGYLLGDEQKEFVADVLCVRILSTNPELEDFLDSSLKNLLKQLTA